MMRVVYSQRLQGAQQALRALEAFAWRVQEELRVDRYPPLYQAGVRYRREKGSHWAMPDEVMERGGGDCEDLSAWRIAELRESGVDPRASFVIRASGRPGLWHIAVRRGDGSLEDPSAVLGMRTQQRARRRRR